ncbi:polyphosphate kinase 1 [uncultured bacterium]|uniref:Polyphosphate kinase n=2 Tax=Acetilactobacillus jinshanensis TaxID=1720083 RepID=A0A4P6ZKB5_9LACO|nr:polyphosphate kinase 1 [Acetilactobacillus jinshanensis]URL61081.1 polyphosphate kinase 1 [uncultured bacterium]
MMINLKASRYYNNRELTWLDFNERVLDEARDRHNPLLERLNFLAITQNNLDQFIGVRMAKVEKRMQLYPELRDMMGLTYQNQLNGIRKKTRDMIHQMYQVLHDLLPELHKHNINLLSVNRLTPYQHKFINRYFKNYLLPTIVPSAVDATRPFPFVRSGQTWMAILIENPFTETESFAVCPIACAFPRVIKLPSNEHHDNFVLQEDVVKSYIKTFFQNFLVEGVACFRLLRDQDIALDDRHTTNLLRMVNYHLRELQYGKPLMLELQKGTSPKIKRFLQHHYSLTDKDTCEVSGPLDLHFVGQIVKSVKGTGEHQKLFYKKFMPFFPRALKEGDIFSAIRRHDWFFNRPFDSFQPVIMFLQQAAEDPKVVEVRISLYRVSSTSPIIKALEEAAENGKQVMVLIELKARGNEQANVKWAHDLQAAGCRVIYGLRGMKTHCKLTLVVRREGNGLRRYVHMATGNYNDKTAKHYVDMDILTANPVVANDANKIFDMLFGYSRPDALQQLVIAPFSIKKFIKAKIKQEIKNVRKGKPAAIFMKMNSLSDDAIIKALYEAGYVGVKIHLIVRGICDIRLNNPKISKHIKVHSIVGRFLEHSRIYAFKDGKHPQVYLSSADMMPRNLDRRVELMFPVLDSNIRKQVLWICKLMWKDNAKTRVLQPDDTWKHVHIKKHDKRLDYQQYYAKHAKQIAMKLYKHYPDCV